MMECKKTVEPRYVRGPWDHENVLLLYQVFWQSYIQRGRQKQLHNHFSKELGPSKSAQPCYKLGL